MVHPIGKPSSEMVQNALFDYLNLNRHKFDAYGNFDPTPHERDFLPRLLLVSDEYKPPKLTPANPRLNRAQQNRAKYPAAYQSRDPKTDEDFVRERYEERMEHRKKRRKYNNDQCEKHYEAALKRCNDMYWNNALYPDGSFEGCKQRATELWQDCHNKGRYPEGKMEWANKDMDIVDDKEISKSTETKFDTVQPAVVAPLMMPQGDLNAWAKSHLQKPPLVEGSIVNDPTESRRVDRFARPGWRGAGVRAKPGMAHIGGGMSGGGKRRFLPRFPGDQLFSPAPAY